VCVCVRACMRVCVRACMRMCILGYVNVKDNIVTFNYFVSIVLLKLLEER